MSKHSRSVIAQLNSINVDHWDDNPLNLIWKVTFAEFLQKSIHHPWSNCLTRMLSGYCDSNRFRLSLFIEYQVRYLIAQDGLSQDISPGIVDLMQSSIKSLKSIRRLAREFDFIVIMLKIKGKAEGIKFAFDIFKELNGLWNVSKLGVLLFFRQIKRFESLLWWK